MRPRWGIVAALLPVLAGRAQAQTDTIRLAGDLSSFTNVALDVPVVANWSARPDLLGSFALTLRWDPTVLSLTSLANGSFGPVVTNSDSVAQGVLKLTGANPTGASGEITLAVPRFTPLSNTNTTVQVQVGQLYTAAPGFQNVLSTAVVDNGLYCPALGFWGDVDGDGAVDSRDALLVLSAVVGLDVSAYPNINALGDVVGTGTLTATDALVILMHTVGLDVSATYPRVAQLAIGSCGSTVATAYTVVPGTATLLVTQAAQLAFQASSNGAARVLTGVTWRSSNPGVASVTPQGVLVAVAPGTATLEAHSGLVDSGGAVITVVARETRHYVQASAVANTNQLGTSALPLATLTAAAQLARNGDTVYVLPGTYTAPVVFDSNVVVLGAGTPAAPVLLAPDSAGMAAVTLNGPGRSELHDVTITTGYRAVAVGPADTVVLDSVTATSPAGTCGDAAVSVVSIPALYVRDSHFAGGGATCNYGIEISGNAGLVVVDSTEISDFGIDALYAYNADSVAIVGSSLHNNYAAVEVSGSGTGGTTIANVPASPTVALFVDSSRVTANTLEGIYAELTRSAWIAHSFIAESVGEPIVVVDGSGSSGSLHLLADSLALTGATEWVNAEEVDSVLVDSVRVFGTVYAGLVTGSSYVQVLTSSVEGLQSEGAGIEVEGGTVMMDSVTVAGSAACNLCATGIYTGAAQTTLSRVSGQNLYQGIESYDTSLSVTGSSFADVTYGIYGSGLSGTKPVVNVQSTTLTNASYGVYLLDRIGVLGALTVNGGLVGVYTYGGTADTVRGSAFTNSEYGVETSDTTTYVANNVFTTPEFTGVYLASGVTTGATVLGNTFACDSTGSDVYAVYGGAANVTVQSNTVTDCDGGLYLYGAADTNTATVRGNTIAVTSMSFAPGVEIVEPFRAVVVGNTITGGDQSGSISLLGEGSGAMVPYGRVDSNTVQSPQGWGILAENVDTLGMRGNLVQDFSLPSSAVPYAGAVIVYGVAASNSTRLVANTLRRTHGNGIVVDRSDTSTVVLDSNAISQADSAAVDVQDGKITMTGDNIEDNHRYGVYIGDASHYIEQIHGGAFVSDSSYGVFSTTDSVDASGNWWNSTLGPLSGLGSDSVAGRVSTIGFLTSLPLQLPALAPPLPPLARRVRASMSRGVSLTAQAPSSLTVATGSSLSAPPLASPPAAPAAVTSWHPVARDANSRWAQARLRAQRFRVSHAPARTAATHQLALADAARIATLKAPRAGVVPVPAPKR